MSTGFQYKTEDIIGMKNNRLTIVEDLGIINKRRKVVAKCECGITKVMRLEAIVSGSSVSCGCLQKEVTSKHFKKHGLYNHPLRSVWKGMIRRCYSIKCLQYADYGALGVEVCTEWKKSFIWFYEWAIKNGWRQGLQLDKDKLSPHKGGVLYSPEYCCFLTPKENQQYKRNSREFEYNGQILSLNELVVKSNVCRSTINKRLQFGWSIEKIISTPINSKFSTKKKTAA